jgi:AbiV family abortive infection protein
VDLRAIKAARRAELFACASAAARNAQGLLRDAEMLAGSGSAARAYSLAALAVEECGKAAVLTALAVLPKRLRAQAPVGRLLEWHQLKQVGGLLIAAVTYDPPGLAPKLAAMPAAQVTHILSTLNVPADEADRLKRRGLYVDMDRNGRIREPSEITEAEVNSQLARAQQAAESSRLLLGSEAQARFAHPPPEAIELARALVSVLTQAQYARTPEAAVDVMLDAVGKLRERCDGQGCGGRGGHARAERAGGALNRRGGSREPVRLLTPAVTGAAGQRITPGTYVKSQLRPVVVPG